MLHIQGLFIMQAGEKGLGVFTAEALQKGDLIEICPVIQLNAQDLEHLDNTSLYQYYFLWPKKAGGCIALGYGSLYNHSSEANASFDIDEKAGKIYFRATKKIAEGIEITIDYLEGKPEEIKLWFKEA